jgi:molybdenum cofactor cytidylyltransferase
MESTPSTVNEYSIAAVILAAGDSKRLGQPKQLLDFNGKTFIENVIEAAIEAKLSPIVVVLGSDAQKVQKKIVKYKDKITIAPNPEWNTGQSSSLRVAIPFVNEESFTIFLLTDQPQITPALLEKLSKTANSTANLIVATYVGEKRSNPVAFSKDLYPELAAIKGDQGGRFLFSKYEIEKMEWNDDRILIDVDTPEDYARLKEAYGLK